MHFFLLCWKSCTSKPCHPTLIRVLLHFKVSRTRKALLSELPAHIEPDFSFNPLILRLTPREAPRSSLLGSPNMHLDTARPGKTTFTSGSRCVANGSCGTPHSIDRAAHISAQASSCLPGLCRPLTIGYTAGGVCHITVQQHITFGEQPWSPPHLHARQEMIGVSALRLFAPGLVLPSVLTSGTAKCGLMLRRWQANIYRLNEAIHGHQYSDFALSWARCCGFFYCRCCNPRQRRLESTLG